MNALAAVALIVLAAAQDPRAFKMPKKASPLPAKPAESAKAAEPASEPRATKTEEPAKAAPEPAKPAAAPLPFRMPNQPEKKEAAPATSNEERATSPATPANREFTLPNETPKPRKKKAARPFRLPAKNNVSN